MPRVVRLLRPPRLDALRELALTEALDTLPSVVHVWVAVRRLAPGLRAIEEVRAWRLRRLHRRQTGPPGTRSVLWTRIDMIGNYDSPDRA